MRKNTYFWTSRGFSLPELMMAAAILGGLSIGFMKLTQNGVESNKRIESGSQIEEIRKEIIGILSNREACEYTFALYNNFTDVMGGTAKSIPAIRDKNNAIRFSAGQTFTGGTKLNSIQVKDYKGSASTAGLVLSFNYYLNSKQLIDKMKRVDLQLEIDTSKILTSCVALAGVQNVDLKQLCDSVVGFDSIGASYFRGSECQFAIASCEKVGGVWDTVNNKCNLNQDKYEYPTTCSITFTHQDNTAAARSVVLNMSSGGLAGIRLRGDVNSDDKFMLRGNCGTGNDLDAYFKNCTIGLGWRDSTDNNSTTNTTPLSTKAYDASFGNTLTLQTGGDVNEDDSFYIRMRCPNGSNVELNTYVKENCQICLGQSDVWKTSPQNMVCSSVQNTSDSSWARFMTGGDVSADDAFYIGFFCKGEYFPKVKAFTY